MTEKVVTNLKKRTANQVYCTYYSVTIAMECFIYSHSLLYDRHYLPSALISLVPVSRRSQGSQPDNKHSDWSEDSEEVPKTADNTEKEQVGESDGWLRGRGFKYVCIFASYL